MSWVDPGSDFRYVKDVLFGEYLKVMTCLMAFPAIQFSLLASTSMAQACCLTHIVVEGENLLVVAAVTQHQTHLACC